MTTSTSSDWDTVQRSTFIQQTMVATSSTHSHSHCIYVHLSPAECVHSTSMTNRNNQHQLLLASHFHDGTTLVTTLVEDHIVTLTHPHIAHPHPSSHSTPSPILTHHTLTHPHPSSHSTPSPILTVHPLPASHNTSPLSDPPSQSYTAKGCATPGWMVAGWITAGWGSATGGRSGPWGRSFLSFFLPRRFQPFTSSLVGGGGMPSACRKNKTTRSTLKHTNKRLCIFNTKMMQLSPSSPHR